MSDPWQVDQLDLDGYLKRLGVPAREPSRMTLAELHEAPLECRTYQEIGASPIHSP